ncbi:MAG: NADH-quinone oxidoreductase subunit J [Planctomycetia bacterium]|nr:NADH-quinone oxidoreductase subunit J [Planctomycetia bacterium]
MFLVLPRPGQKQHWLGVLLFAAGLGLFGSQVPLLGKWLDQGTFWVLALLTVGAAAAAMSLRNPVYCAVWFGMSLLGTAGLMFVQGAQFLGVATMVVYAGAILVTLLFVLMLANPEGRGAYDRTAWDGHISAAAGISMVGLLTMMIAAGLRPSYAAGPVVRSPADDILAKDHVARLGAELFSRHLVAIEIGGVLLLAALVGAVAIVVHTRGSTRPASDMAARLSPSASTARASTSAESRPSPGGPP